MRFFRKYHKWAGLVLAFFIVMFAVSGIILNHRKFFSQIDIPRALLPKTFHYNNWNNASIKGSLKLSPDSILLYGGASIWLTDFFQTDVVPLTTGIRKGTDNQIIGRIVKTSDNKIYAISTFDFYKLCNDTWKNITHLLNIEERISDMEINGDTLVVLTRSHAYYSVIPFNDFEKIEIKQPDDYEAKTSLFRILWLLHSGELFGIGGKIFVDILGILLIVVSVTGVIYFFSPNLIKRKKRKEKSMKGIRKTITFSVKWHNKIGVVFLVFFLLLTLTGMFLRPPLLIAIVRSKVNNFSGTILRNKNPWHDKLRTIRYDNNNHKWLLYTSSGFYDLKNLHDIPEKIVMTPPVSVMGVTVMEPTQQGWLIGSFNGLFYWNRERGLILDCYTGQPASMTGRGRPVSNNPVSGYSGDFQGQIVFEYNKGAVTFDSYKKFVSMPEEIGKGRMSLWHTALEVHTGRAYCYLLGLSGDLFSFLWGLLILLLLISGYIVYMKKYKKYRGYIRYIKK